MEHYDKVVKSRRYTKLLLFGLVSVICFLLFALHNENKGKERLVKRESDLIVKLSASKNGENAANSKLEETSVALEEQRKQVEAQKKQSGELQIKFDTLSKSFKQKVSELETIKKDSSKIQKNLDAGLIKQNGQLEGKMKSSTASTTAHT